MLQDVNTGIAWVLRHAPAFGGDGASFHLVGQSAGGQLAAMALLLQVAARSQAGGVVGASPAWDPSLISGFVGVRWGARAGSKDCGVHGGAQGAGGAPLACRARCPPLRHCFPLAAAAGLPAGQPAGLRSPSPPSTPPLLDVSAAPAVPAAAGPAGAAAAPTTCTPWPTTCTGGGCTATCLRQYTRWTASPSCAS